MTHFIRRLRDSIDAVCFPDFPANAHREFRRYYNEQNANVTWYTMWVGVFCILVFVFWDYVTDQYHWKQTLAVRVITASYVATLALLPVTIFRKWLQPLAASATAVAGIGVVTVISIVADGLVLGAAGVLLVLMFNFGFARLLFIPSVLSGMVTSVAYSVAAVAAGLPTTLIIANNFFLIAALFSGSVITLLLERLYRKQFLIEEELAAEREALARQHLIDARYLEWLRRLADFLRHEVRQPVAQISSSIEVMRIAGSTVDLKPQLDSATTGVNQVWNLIERASQATDAEAFVRQGHPQEIDLDTVIPSLVDEFRRTHYGARFSFSGRGAGKVRVDAMLLREAVSNLLGNAASFAEDGSTIEVNVEHIANDAVLKVTNRGPTITADIETLFQPFTSTRLDTTDQHQGLGLYLVRLIAEQAGGRAQLANRADGRGVEAWITFPRIRDGE